MLRLSYTFWVVILFTGLSFSVTSCDSDSSSLDSLQDLEVEIGSDIAYEVTMNYTDGAEKVMMLEAPELKRVEGNTNKDVFPKGILVTFHQEGGTEFATLRSDYAERLADEYLVIASDNVVFENINGEKLETSQLKWDEKKEKIFTNRFARLTRPDEIIYGYGFTANQDFTEIEFEKTTGKKPVPMLEPRPEE